MKKNLAFLLVFSIFFSFFSVLNLNKTAEAISPFAVTDAELAVAREQFFGNGSSGDNFSFISGVEREIVHIDDSRVIHKPQVYEIPELLPESSEIVSYSVVGAGFFSVGETRSFFTSTHGSTAQTGTLMAQGAHTNIWVLNNPGVNAGYVDTAIAQSIATTFDGIYSRMTHPTTGFAPFANVRIETNFGSTLPLVGDLSGDGKVNFLLYDIDNDGASSSGYVGGFFTNGDFITGTGRNGLDMLHMDIGTNQGFKNLTSANEEERLVFYDTMAHEFQHLLYYMYFGVYRPSTGYDSDAWVNETLSELAGAFYTSSGRELVSFSRLAAAAGNNHDGSGYRDFLNFAGMKGYGMSKTFGHFLHKRYPNVVRNIYSSMIVTYPPATSAAGHNANIAKITNMPQAVGNLLRAGTNNTIGTGGQNTMSLLYYLFMESFAADGGVIHTSPTTQSTKLFAPATTPTNNLWAIRPAMGVAGGRVFLSGTSGSYFDVASYDAIPVLSSGVAGSISLQGFGGTSARGATHERIYRLNGGGAGSPFLRVTAPNDGNAETRYYIAVPNDTVTTGATTYSSGSNGAALYPLVKGSLTEINTNGRPAYLFVSTIYRNVNSSITYSWSAVSDPGIGGGTTPPVTPPSGGNDILGETKANGNGSIVYTDTNIYSVLLPTAESWDFVLDPQGLIGAHASGTVGNANELSNATPSDLAPFAGKIISGSYVPTAINNSSFDVTLGVTLRVTGDAVAVTSESAVHAGISNNILLTVEPAANSVNTQGAEFVGSGTGYAVLNTAGELKFVLDSANYVFNAVPGSSGSEFSYDIVPNTGKGTQLKIGGYCNKNADWTQFADDTKGVGINAVFSFSPAVASENALSDVSGAYGLKEYGLSA
ncbi:MAG: hypothetical protein FWD34_01805 [Oscillospiraceae bacterium]|nr:hypothetical protein [Oscillospiraceae bacterium]